MLLGPFAVAIIGIGVIVEYVWWARGLVRLAGVPSAVGEAGSRIETRKRWAAWAGWGALASMVLVGMVILGSILDLFDESRPDDLGPALILGFIALTQVFRIAGIALVWPVLRYASAFDAAPGLRVTLQWVAALGIAVAVGVGTSHLAFAGSLLGFTMLEPLATAAVVAVPASFVMGLVGAITLAVVSARLRGLVLRVSAKA
ncbi:MAG: hypothetical protein AAF328_10655 [Planctomycetota bacterium]